jgi:predicted Zn finger-like uncharacterized protein
MAAHSCLPTQTHGYARRTGLLKRMILTCPACGTQYVVKDGAIPTGGRQVRCASCKHSWHQDPEDAPEEVEQAAPEPEIARDEPGPDPQEPEVDASAGEEAPEPPGYAPIDPVAPPADPFVEPSMAAPMPPEEDEVQRSPGGDDEFSPFAQRETQEEPRRSPLMKVLVAVLLLAALAAALWYLAPQEWRARLGLAQGPETPLQLMMTHSDRQRLASGNELLAVTGRVINPTQESQAVPPIQAQLRSSSGKLVYSWTIAPPARTLPPGASATFNSAEVNVPAGGEELTISLGRPTA